MQDTGGQAKTNFGLIVVKLNNLEQGHIDDVIARCGGKQEGKGLRNINTIAVRVPEDTSCTILKIYKKDPDVRNAFFSVQVNPFSYFGATMPSDSRIASQYNIKQSEVIRAWEHTTGDSSIRIGVADSSLGSNYLTGNPYTLSDYPELDGQTIEFYDSLTGLGGTREDGALTYQHGISVTGVILAAHGGTGAKLAGASPDVSLTLGTGVSAVPGLVDVYSWDAFAQLSVVDELFYDRGCNIITMSWGIFGNGHFGSYDGADGWCETTRDFFEALWDDGCLLVCATQNEVYLTPRWGGTYWNDYRSAKYPTPWGRGSKMYAECEDHEETAYYKQWGVKEFGEGCDYHYKYRIGKNTHLTNYATMPLQSGPTEKMLCVSSIQKEDIHCEYQGGDYESPNITDPYDIYEDPYWPDESYWIKNGGIEGSCIGRNVHCVTYGKNIYLHCHADYTGGDNSILIELRVVSEDGTSFSTPLIAAIASLAWSINPDLTNDEVKQIMRESYYAPMWGFWNDYWPECGGPVSALKAVLKAKATLPANKNNVYTYIKFHGNPKTVPNDFWDTDNWDTNEYSGNVTEYVTTNTAPTISLSGTVKVEIDAFSQGELKSIYVWADSTLIYSGMPGLFDWDTSGYSSAVVLTVKGVVELKEHDTDSITKKTANDRGDAIVRDSTRNSVTFKRASRVVNQTADTHDDILIP